LSTAIKYCSNKDDRSDAISHVKSAFVRYWLQSVLKFKKVCITRRWGVGHQLASRECLGRRSRRLRTYISSSTNLTLWYSMGTPSTRLTLQRRTQVSTCHHRARQWPGIWSIWVSGPQRDDVRPAMRTAAI